MTERTRRAKRKAATEGRTLTSLIEEGLRRVVAEEREAKAPVLTLPRISKARGGFTPGIASVRDIEELEDLEYIERLRRL
jgi:hypothetical protein